MPEPIQHFLKRQKQLEKMKPTQKRRNQFLNHLWDYIQDEDLTSGRLLLDRLLDLIDERIEFKLAKPEIPEPGKDGNTTQPAPGVFVPESEIQELRRAWTSGKILSTYTEGYKTLDRAVKSFLKSIEKGGTENE